MPFNGSTQTINTREVRQQRLDEELEAELQARAKAKEAPAEGSEEEPAKETKGWEKRHNDMKSFMQKQLNEREAELRKLKAQLDEAAKKQIKFPKTEEEVGEWIEKYPDVAAIVKTIAMKEVANVREQVEARDVELQKRAYQIEFERCLNKVVNTHPDFWDLRENEAFVDWIQAQPKKIRSAFDPDLEYDDLEDAADTVIYAIKLFKMETTPVEKPKKVDNSREAARQVTTRNNGATPREKPENHILLSEIEKMGIREYEKREDEIKKAYAEGRIIDDINGAAR